MIVLGYSSMHTYYMLWAVESSAYPYNNIGDLLFNNTLKGNYERTGDIQRASKFS
jgi:hypothetical protein